MAITRAQQARQLYKNGKRVGFFSAGLAAGDDISPGTNTSGESRDDRTRERSDPESLALAFGNKNKTKKGPEQIVGGLSDKQKKIRQIISEQRKKAKGELKPSTTTKNRVISGLLGLLNPFGIPFSGSIYNRAIDSRAMGYGKSKGPPEETVERGRDDFIDIMADNTPVYDEEFTPYEGGEIAKLIAERDKNEAYRFFANGGRAAFQEGGIMPRLNQLGSGVSSAEQMLQGINQKLESAESNLGEGSAVQQPSLQQPMSPLENAMFDKDGFRLGDQRYGTGFGQQPQYGLDQPPQMALPENPMSGGPMQSPLAGAMRNMAANNGRATLAGGGMPYEGGIMDLESGRQQYFLGKLVKKAKRAIGKITKSKAGKAALLAGLGAYGFNKFGGFKGIGEGFGKGFNFLKEGYDNIDMDGKDKFSLLAAAGLTAAPLLFQDDEEDPDFTSNRGPGLDIEELRKNPYATMGGSYRFYADGGEVEPVAKETMPLLDMNNQEMDLRAEGGFVPIGRMEKADDVPARLSKNEFVFTADAVRNAGEGDIDKGAEVMYNMMKNLESGGEVSEESQGLDGAKEMFQTSKRLEEVL